MQDDRVDAENDLRPCCISIVRTILEKTVGLDHKGIDAQRSDNENAKRWNTSSGPDDNTHCKRAKERSFVATEGECCILLSDRDSKECSSQT